MSTFGEKAVGLSFNHATNKVRGILCHDCNIAVGAYERTILPNLDAFAKWIVR